MRAEPFSISDAERLLAHPDTPAAYVAWTEVLPLTGSLDREHLGNALAWSHRTATRTLGASRPVFAQALAGASDELIDAWMRSLGTMPVDVFLDNAVPFLRNLATVGPRETPSWIAAFLDAAGHETSFAPPPAPRRPVPSAPDSVILEITRSCNFACTMCSSRTGGFLPERTMTLDTFGDLVRVLGASARALRINGYGETAIVPDLPRYLSCLDEFGFTGLREIITNLSAPTGVYEDILSRGFVLLASWDAARREAFERIRIGADYGAMESRLRTLGGLVRSCPERLGLLCTVQAENLGEVVPVVEMAADVGAGLVILNMVKLPGADEWMAAHYERICETFLAADAVALHRGVTLRIPDHVGGRSLRSTQVHRSSGTYCDRPWRELLVRWDTEATVCNMFHPWSYGLLVPPGPSRDLPTRFRRLWDGPNAQAMRRHINRVPAHPYCRDCYYLYG